MSLENKCYEKICDTIQHMPPLLQEIVIGESTKKIENRVKQEVFNTSRLYIIQELKDLLPLIIPDIIKDKICYMNNGIFVNDDDYKKRYSNIDSNIIDIAISIGDSAAKIADDYHVYSNTEAMSVIFSEETDDYDY